MTFTGMLQEPGLDQPEGSKLISHKGIRATIAYDGAAVGLQIDSVGCVTVTYHPEGENPRSLYIAFIEDLPTLDLGVIVEQDGTVTVEWPGIMPFLHSYERIPTC